MDSKDQAVKFIGKFLSWYQDSYGRSVFEYQSKLSPLVKEAEEIHIQRLKEFDKELSKPKIKRKKISRFL